MPLPLIERSEKEVAQKIRKKVESLKDVKGYHQLNVRITGKRYYVDMHVLLDNNLKFEETHRIASRIEREVKNVIPNARVTIHTEPLGNSKESIWRTIKETAEAAPGSRGIHNIHIQTIDGKLCVDLHLEVSANMTVQQAHEVSNQVEKRIRAANPNISEITIHMESASDLVSQELGGVERDLESYIEDAAKGFPEIKRVHGIEIRRVGDSLHIVLRCHFDPNINMQKAHEISNELERTVKSAYPSIARIDVHEEPA